MNKYQKMGIGFLILAISVVLIYVFFAFGEIGLNSSGSNDSGFQFFILFANWPAIWIPIMVRKREEAREKDKNQYIQRRV